MIDIETKTQIAVSPAVFPLPVSAEAQMSLPAMA
jgi:hypothetical protein